MLKIKTALVKNAQTGNFLLNHSALQLSSSVSGLSHNESPNWVIQSTISSSILAVITGLIPTLTGGQAYQTMAVKEWERIQCEL